MAHVNCIPKKAAWVWELFARSVTSPAVKSLLSEYKGHCVEGQSITADPMPMGGGVL